MQAKHGYRRARREETCVFDKPSGPALPWLSAFSASVSYQFGRLKAAVFKDSESIKKLLDVFELGTPKLVVRYRTKRALSFCRLAILMKATALSLFW